MVVVEELKVLLLGDNKNLKSAVKDSTTALGMLNKAGKVAFAAVAAGAAAAGAGAAVAANKFIGFEKGMAEVATLGNFTREELEAMEDQVKSLSSELGASGGTAEVTAGLYNTLSAGFTDTADAQKILEAAIKSGIAGVSDTNTAVDALTTVLNSYGMTADEVTKVQDIFQETIRRGKTTFPELASAIGRVTAIAPAVGVSFEEIAAATATLTASGVNTDQTMTALTGVMRAFLKPSAEMQAKLEEIGFASGSAAIEALGFQGALDAVGAGVDQAGLGKLFQDTEALKAALPLLGSQSDSFAQNLQAMADSTGAAEAAFQKMDDTSGQSLQKLKNKIEAALIEVGGPVIEAVTQMGESFAEAFGGDSAGAVDTIKKAIQDMTPALVSIASAAGKVARFFAEHPALMNAVAAAVAVLAIAFVAIQVAMFGAAVAGAAASAAFLPIVVTVLAIAAAVALAIAIFKNWDSIVAFTVKTWETIKQKAHEIWNGIANFFKEHWKKMLVIFLGPIGILVGLIVQNWDTIKTKTVEVFDAVLSKIKEWGDKVISFFTDLDLVQAGKDLLFGFRDGIVDGWNAVKARVEDIAGKAVEVWNDVWGISSPSRVAMDIGENIVAGFGKGIEGLDALTLRAATPTIPEPPRSLLEPTGFASDRLGEPRPTIQIDMTVKVEADAVNKNTEENAALFGRKAARELRRNLNL